MSLTLKVSKVQSHSPRTCRHHAPDVESVKGSVTLTPYL